ncbi:rRNA N6-adenosine-methyltransferase METTL5, partial [Phenoliferia sp. Uapishka_3]
MKLKELESGKSLSILDQDVHLASRLLFSAEASYGDIEDKRILDLGCGCAVLSIGAVMLGASSVLAVDVDTSALSIARENIEKMEMEDEIELLQAVIGSLAKPTASAERAKERKEREREDAMRDEDGELVEVEKEEEEEDKIEVPVFDPKSLGREFDTVVMNPPFGTWNQGIDMVFLEVACQIAETAVYSLHKTSTREFILKKAKSLGFEGEVVAEMKYALPKTMAFHKSKSVDIQVDFWRFVRVQPKIS